MHVDTHVETTRPGTDSSPRALIVTAAMGAGHTQVAQELARRLGARGACPEVVDILSAAGPAGTRLRRTYQFLLRRAPWLYDAAMRFWARVPKPLEALTAAGSHPFERALSAQVDRFAPDVVVSTYDLASQALGRLVGRGELDAPVVTLVVDPGAHPYWVSEAVSRHLVLTGLTGRQLRNFGAEHVHVVRPVLRPEFDDPPDPERARARLGLPADVPVALVTAGSWAAGRIESTVRLLTEIPDLLVVVLCGRDAQLHEQLSGELNVWPVPWTNETAAYLAAADVVIDNAGGLTCWEALACRTPVLLFQSLPGHGRFNAATLDEAGLATWVQHRGDLRPAVEQAMHKTGRLPDPSVAEDTVSAILEAVEPARAAAR